MTDYGMVIPADARAMGAVNAINRGKRFMQKPRSSDYRTGNRAGECISYFVDDKSDARIFKPAHNRKQNRRRVVIAQTRVDVDHALMARMGTVHQTI